MQNLLGTELQWSRPQLRTETGTLCQHSFGQSAASMEPSSVEDGNPSALLAHRALLKSASMEPSSVEDGNGPLVDRPRRSQVMASMEPSSVEDGNCCGVAGFGQGRRRFNGAVLS